MKSFNIKNDKKMDLDNFERFGEYTFFIFLTIGGIGLGLLFLNPVLAFFLPFWSFEHNSFLIILSISLWMTTFILPALSKIGTNSLMTKMYRWSTESYRSQAHYLRNRNKFEYKIEKFKHRMVWGIYYSILILLPLFATIYSQFQNQAITIMALIPLMLHIFLTLLYIFNSNEYTWGLIPAIVSIGCILFLWFHPYFHPYKIFTIYLTTGEVMLSGITSTST